MNKFTVRPNKSVKDIVKVNAEMRKHSMKMYYKKLGEERKVNEYPSYSTLINPASLE